MSERFDELVKNLLLQGVKFGVKQLTPLALDFIAGILGLRRSNELEAAVKRILEHVESVGAHLQERHNELVNLLNDQLEAKFAGILRDAKLVQTTYLGLSWEQRVLQLQQLSESPRHDLSRMCGEIEYLLREEDDSSRVMLERLALLPLYILGVEMKLGMMGFASSLNRVRSAFELATQSRALSFQEWVTGLGPRGFEQITQPDDAAIQEAMKLTLDFFEELVEKGIVDRYLSDHMTPLLTTPPGPGRFTGRRDQFSEPAVVTNPDSWESVAKPPSDRTDVDSDESLIRLARHAKELLRDVEPSGVNPVGTSCYYVQVPSGDCLVDPPLRSLVEPTEGPSAYLPQHEVAGDLSASPCNRFWILNSRWSGKLKKGGVGSYTVTSTSFDGHKMIIASWSRGEGFFEAIEADPNLQTRGTWVAYDLHRKLLRGRLVRMAYGGAGAVLDAIHEVLHGTARTPNRWDVVLAEHTRWEAIFSVPQSRSQGIHLGEVLEAERSLSDRGESLESMTLETWVYRLGREVHVRNLRFR